MEERLLKAEELYDEKSLKKRKKKKNVSASDAADRTVSLQDIMNELKKLSTKEDLVQVKRTFITQSA